ncbi:hypothetical protein BDA99DRAFT_578325 [Phascolomyces articulosus]|uniref:Zn(2)-C6 fungal-type domain-containing protein n=1 Tax=Phascolomyces articulosus TaxID=60185 RepID=A0AAD5KCI9_9FUNG|nr:hypothetical protein BDA99DRAFT_578325 [Phascolomyces articulosus]
MYSCDLFYGDDAFNFGQDEKQHQLPFFQQAPLQQHQQQHQYQHPSHHHPHHQQQQSQGLLLNDTYPKLQPLLDYTPDLVPNDTPDDDPLTNFDELCMPTSSSSPQVSSYLQYLKEPSASVDYSNAMMSVMSTVDDAACCWPGMDPNTNSLLLCPNNNTLLPSETTSTTTTHSNTSCNNNTSASTTSASAVAAAAAAAAVSMRPTNEWFCEPPETYFASDFCNDPPTSSGSMDDGFQSDSLSGMTREYVSLSDVNSFVAEADSQKHAASIHLSYSTPNNLQFLGNEDSFAQLTSFASVPASLADLAPPPTISPPTQPTLSSSTSLHHPHQHHHHLNHQHIHHSVHPSSMPPPSPENNDSDSETVSSTRSSSIATATTTAASAVSNYWKEDMWKSTYDTKTTTAMKRTRRKKMNNGRKNSDVFPKQKRNNSKKSTTHARSPMPVSESISSFLARQKLSDDDEDNNGLHLQPTLTTSTTVDEDFDLEEEDDEYIYRGDGQPTSSLRKGRNVDKACNHCKRSHLRCDNMRPCRRCVATGKTGCKDVEHKPRGRPRLNKNQHSVKTRGI